MVSGGGPPTCPVFAIAEARKNRENSGGVLTPVFKQMRAHRKMQLDETPPRPRVSLPAASSPRNVSALLYGYN